MQNWRRAARRSLCVGLAATLITLSTGCAMMAPTPRSYLDPAAMYDGDDGAMTRGLALRRLGVSPATPASAGEELVAPTAAAEDRPAAASPRHVVYNAQLRIVVGEIPHALQQAEALATRLGGYMQTIRGDSIILRVPAERFNEALTELERFGPVSDRAIDALDVTEEYVDLEARLRTAQATAKRLEALLERAQSVTDTVAIEKELARVNTEIEQLVGRLNLLKSRVAFSTITLHFERIARSPTVRDFRQLPFQWLRSLEPALLWE